MKLEELRSQIDEIDDGLFTLLQERLAVVGQVGEFKKASASEKYIIRSGREALKVKAIYNKAVSAGMDKKTALAMVSLWRLLIALSINHESAIKLAFAKTNDDMPWLLREYFGVFSGKTPTANDSQTLDMLTSGEANIGAFAIHGKPKAEPWWLAVSRQTELNIFASPELFSVSGATPATLLVSKVTPEPSGEDKFFFVVSGRLPADCTDSFDVVSEYEGYLLVSSDEFYNDYSSKLNAKYIGCSAIFSW